MHKARIKKAVAASILTIVIAAIITWTLLPRKATHQAKPGALSDETIYQGKSISQWIVELPVGQQRNALGFVDPETPAKKVLRSIGPNVMPSLARAMVNERGETFLTDLELKLWHRSSYLQSHFPRPVYPLEIRRAACGMLAEMVAGNPQVVPDEEIIRSFSKLTRDKDSDLRIIGVSTLGIIAVKGQSQSALSELITALDSPDEGVRVHAAGRLSEGGPALSQALPVLNSKLSDRSDAVRINAALAVYRIGQQTNEAVAVLIGALNSKVPTHRGNAAYHLSLIGSAAKAAVPALEVQAKDTDEYARESARRALQRIDPEHHKGQN